MTPRTRRVSATDGLQLVLYEWSDAGVPLLFLHGFDNDAHVWDQIAPVMAPYYRTLALDQRGHGDSDRDPEGRYASDAMAADARAVLDGVGAERVVLVGHSMGARVSMHFAAAWPSLLAGLVLVDAGPDFDARGVTRIRLETEESAESYASVAEFAYVLERRYADAPPGRMRELAGHWLRRRADGRFEPKTDPLFMRGRAGEAETWEQRRADETKQLWDALARVPCPALVVRGAASDVLSPETADRMADEVLPKGRLVVIPRAGHSVMLDNPPAFEKALCDFALGPS